VASDSAERMQISGDVQEPALCEATRDQALALSLLGWVMVSDSGALEVHAEGDQPDLDRLAAWLQARPETDGLVRRPVKLEGHEQFAIRGVPAGVFMVREAQDDGHRYELRLEVDGVMRSWLLPKGPSLDPSVKRFAKQGEDHRIEENDLEGRTERGAALIWDRGSYEHRGRVAWPEALERGHAMFVLHGEKLTGGFALQRTGSGWLLIKRRDEYARPGSEVTDERPESVAGGLTLAALLGGD
jgi:DNA ligase D-like protein (predicted 3'-phosphoesterase)